MSTPLPPKSAPRPTGGRAGFALPAVLVIVSALLILALGMLIVVGTERSTARSYVDYQRADLAVRTGLEDLKGVLISQAANDTFTIVQSTLLEPIEKGHTRSPFLFLAQGKSAGGSAFTFHYTPLFSATTAPPDSTRLSAPEIEPLINADPTDHLTFSTLPFLDQARAAWIPVFNEKKQMVARYAYWVEDLQGKIDPKTTGNADGPGGSHLLAVYPFPAPGLNPEPASALQPALNRIPLDPLDPASTTDKPGELGKILIARRPLLLSPDSILAAADLQPPLTRDLFGHLIDPKARAVEENLATTVQPYLEQPRVPYSLGIDAAVAGEPKLNLNGLIAKGPDAVDQMAKFIQKALPDFDTRKGGFPDDYLKTLAANAIDYADADSASTLTPGSHRGLDAFPLLSEISLQVRYMGLQTVNNRKILNWQFRLFAELWNVTSQEVSGKTRLSYEVALPMEGIGAGTSSKRFDDPTILNDAAKATHQLTKIDDKFWSPELQVTLKPNEYKVYEFAAVTYKLDIGPSSISVASKFSLTEQEGAAGATLMWNDQQVDRANGIIRQKKGLEFELAKPAYSSKATVVSLALGPYGSEVDDLGDPRISYYLRDTAQAENASPENTSPNRRNIRRSSIYDGDSARKPKTYGRTLPSEWPDGGHDSPVGTWTISKDDAMIFTDPSYNWAQNPQVGQAPQRLSNLGRFYSATELGRSFDPLMWRPTYDSTADTTSISSGLMPASRFAWPDALPSSPPSTDHGGGTTLRIGRPEHLAFDRPGKRASQLLDLFHAGQSRSEDRTLREGNTVAIEGHVNLNTAPANALRALAAGSLQQDPLLATTTTTLSHQGAPLMAAPTTKIALYAPSTSPKTEADRIADAILRARPFASPSELANLKDPDGKPVFGNPDLYQSANQLPASTRVQWTDAAAEELFARVYEASTVRSRNFRVWVVGQAITPLGTTATRSNKPPEVLAEVRKVFTLFADPGQRTSDGAIDPKQFHPTVIHEREF